MNEVQLYGRHLLRDQIVAAFEHEGIVAHAFTDLATLYRQAKREVPVIVWTTDNKHAVMAAGQLRLHGFLPHRYWIGSDVLRFITAGRMLGGMLRSGNRCFLSHTANAPWLTDELANRGIIASSLPINPACCAEHWPMPPAPTGPYTVIYYSLADNDAIYQPGAMMAAATALPGVRFLTIGNRDLSGGPANVEHRGLLSAEACRRLYRESDAVVRFTSHDGFSRMVLEAMSSGLDVLFAHEVPHTHRVTSVDEVVATLRRLSSRPRERNIAARNYALAQFTARKWSDAWRRTFDLTTASA
ncbi:MAG TPA: hypothetical protein VGM77_06575 [Gemmatimonadales bacterium]|jgi:hypothetical protein